MLVRPVGDTYQIVGGHTRQKAAIAAGLDTVLCCIEKMDDAEATLRMASDNLNEPFAWFSRCLYVFENSQKDSKKGLSRTALVQSLTGKTGEAAKTDAKRLGACGAVLNYLEQSGHMATLLPTLYDTESDRTRHLAEIHAAPQADWLWLVQEMLDKSLTVSQLNTAAKALGSICEIPEWLQPVFPPEVYKRKAITEERVTSDLSRFVAKATELYEALEEIELIWQFDDTGKPTEQLTVYPQEQFIENLKDMKNPSEKRINEAFLAVQSPLTENKARYQRYEQNKGDRDRERMNRLRFSNLFSPVGVLCDCRKGLAGLKAESIDLVLTDPPYLVSDGGITKRGSKQTKVDKNFDDTLEPAYWIEAVAPKLRPGGSLVFTCTVHILVAAIEAAEANGLVLTQHCIWAKRSAPPRLNTNGFREVFENVLVFHKPGDTPCFNYDRLCNTYHGGNQPSNVLQFEQCSGNERLGWHDTQKPLDLWRYLMDAYSDPGDLVVDPFSGSGTTAVAAKAMLRRCWWFEKDEDFFKKAGQRISDAPMEEYDERLLQ